jgi:CheY-like chemotaxis protein
MNDAAPKPCVSVLVVEDERGIREALREVLELEGYRVKTAANGKEGLEVLRDVHGTCLVLLDLMMPVMNGFEFAKAMRANDVLAPIPIVVVTAFGDAAGFVGAHAVLRKPVDLDMLLTLVQKYCAPAPSTPNRQTPV